MNNDLISRQAAYDELFDMCKEVKQWQHEETDTTLNARFEACKVALIEMKRRIAKLPSIHPELIVAWRFLPKQYTGPKSERDFSGSKTPYEEISTYIEDRMNGLIDDYVVKIKLDGKTYTEILTYNGEYFEWLNDWYEGEQEIELLDFFPLEEAVRGGKNV